MALTETAVSDRSQEGLREEADEAAVTAAVKHYIAEVKRVVAISQVIANAG